MKPELINKTLIISPIDLYIKASEYFGQSKNEIGDNKNEFYENRKYVLID